MAIFHKNPRESRQSLHRDANRNYLKIEITPDDSTEVCLILPRRFRKTGRMWCGGVRETREPRFTIG